MCSFLPSNHQKCVKAQFLFFDQSAKSKLVGWKSITFADWIGKCNYMQSDSSRKWHRRESLTEHGKYNRKCRRCKRKPFLAQVNRIVKNYQKIKLPRRIIKWNWKEKDSIENFNFQGLGRAEHFTYLPGAYPLTDLFFYFLLIYK